MASCEQNIQFNLPFSGDWDFLSICAGCTSAETASWAENCAEARGLLVDSSVIDLRSRSVGERAQLGSGEGLILSSSPVTKFLELFRCIAASPGPYSKARQTREKSVWLEKHLLHPQNIPGLHDPASITSAGYRENDSQTMRSESKIKLHKLLAWRTD